MSVPTSTPPTSAPSATTSTSTSSPPTSVPAPAPASKPTGAWGSNKSIAATVLANADKPIISARPATSTSTSHHHHVISPESKDMFERGVRIGFDRWDTLNLAVENGWGGRNGIAIKEEFVTQTIAMFLKEKSCPYQDDIEDYLVDGLSEGFHTDAQDDSSNWLSRLLVRLYDDCIVKKDYSGVLKMEAERDKYEEAKTNARANSQIESLTGCESDDDEEEDGSEDGDEKHADGIDEEGEDDDEDDDEDEEDDMEDEKEEIDEKHGPSSNTTDTQPTTTALDSLHIQSTSTAPSTSTSTSTSASTSTSTSTSTSSDSTAMEDDGWTTIPKRGGGRKR